MPEQDARAGELEHAEKVLDMVFPAGDQAARVVKPSEEPLNLPTAAGAAQRPAVLSHTAAASAMAGNHFDPVPGAQEGVERIAVIAAVADQARRERAEEAGVEGRGHEVAFIR